MIGRPTIAITSDGDDERYFSRRPYADAVADAGGIPVLLPHRAELAAAFLERADGLILSGGDDPRMERWGIPTHAAATPVHPSRQAFELALLDTVAHRPEFPVLGICLGMQYMALHAGGALEQHLPDSCPTHAAHWGRVTHEVRVDLGRGVERGEVLSHHRQAVSDAGSLAIAGRALDGVVEAVIDPSRRFYLGVQWHPERTGQGRFGAQLLRRFIEAAIG
ncbi:MAG TPA: gamma-glutamyl-gamma-aminobutyrate hydrolase family protein [Phycisphaerales bacterium]|nr:gamma-glutamyl-gamma-aminobutyrate hydrolase family protein [Phycisphaerales bacterium]HMP37564.1 gamma-glutamyl-gamma-aminobutyrate hydrolase family protein [Phycisphaerales bacterium]